MTERFDAVVIGGGHNGLVAATYLARGGLSVAVLERRSMVGGACITEELFPGYRLSSCSYICHLLQGAGERRHADDLVGQDRRLAVDEVREVALVDLAVHLVVARQANLAERLISALVLSFSKTGAAQTLSSVA